MTDKQRQLLDLIKARTAETGVCPSIREMQETLGWAGTANVHRILSCLREQGYISWLPRHARTIEVHENPVLPAPKPLAELGWGELVKELRRRGFEVALTPILGSAA